VATTGAAIRASMITAMRALVPAQLAQHPYTAAREEVVDGFRKWAEQNPAAAMRRFSIRDVGRGVAPGFEDNVLEHVERAWECVVAYPLRELGLFGADAGRSLEDVMDADAKQVKFAIGTPGFQTLGISSACVINDPPEYETGEACKFVVIPLRVTFWRTA
jgi:hypothetical protein